MDFVVLSHYMVKKIACYWKDYINLKIAHVTKNVVKLVALLIVAANTAGYGCNCFRRDTGIQLYTVNNSYIPDIEF